MNQKNASETPNSSTSNIDLPSSCTLHVCTSCREPGTPREPKERRPGFVLYQQLQEAFSKSPLLQRVKVKHAECLSICPRPCGIALSSSGAWTYLFGDQQPNLTVHEIVDCVALYLESTKGFMKRAQRPKSLRKSILGRVPPQPEVKNAFI